AIFPESSAGIPGMATSTISVVTWYCPGRGPSRFADWAAISSAETPSDGDASSLLPQPASTAAATNGKTNDLRMKFSLRAAVSTAGGGPYQGCRILPTTPLWQPSSYPVIAE